MRLQATSKVLCHPTTLVSTLRAQGRLTWEATREAAETAAAAEQAQVRVLHLHMGLSVVWGTGQVFTSSASYSHCVKHVRLRVAHFLS